MPLRATRANIQHIAEIISIGNELLIGHTLDTNSHWMAKQFAKMGWTLDRVTLIRDSLESISKAIQESIWRKPNILITVGGLGPTYDDMTLSGIALGLHRPLELNREALDLVKERYRRLDTNPKLTAYRKKMALLPYGAKALPNPVGTAPGVMTRAGETILFSLPGVPAEMRAIFEESIRPILQNTKTAHHVEAQMRIVGIIESALAPILDHARRRFPGLYLKSHPRGRETGRRPLILLHIYGVTPISDEKLFEAVSYIVRRLSGIPSARVVRAS